MWRPGRGCARVKMTQAHLDRALGRLGLCPAGAARFGWGEASVSVPGLTQAGAPVWVRVAAVADHQVWMRPDAVGEAAAALGGAVAMPQLLRRTRWQVYAPDEGGVREVRADVFERVRARPVSPEPHLEQAPAVTEGWWGQLRSACDAIAASGGAGPGRPRRMVARWVHHLAGPGIDTAGTVWAPAHGDLHWANLLAAPDLVVTDWEGYSLAPRGLDAAMLLIYSLGHPPSAARVRDLFADVLDGESGRVAQVYAAAEVLSAVDNGFHPHLEAPIRRHLAHLLQPGR